MRKALEQTRIICGELHDILVHEKSGGGNPEEATVPIETDSGLLRLKLLRKIVSKSAADVRLAPKNCVESSQ